MSFEGVFFVDNIKIEHQEDNKSKSPRKLTMFSADAVDESGIVRQITAWEKIAKKVFEYFRFNSFISFISRFNLNAFRTYEGGDNLILFHIPKVHDDGQQIKFRFTEETFQPNIDKGQTERICVSKMPRVESRCRDLADVSSVLTSFATNLKIIFSRVICRLQLCGTSTLMEIPANGESKTHPCHQAL